MESDSILKNIARDIANVQHGSDVLSQWPISSVRAMYYSGPFFLPEIGKNIMSWKNDPSGMFKQNLMPGKITGLIFYFLNERGKEKMGANNHKSLLMAIISKIMAFKQNNYLEDYTSNTWMPEWNLNLDVKKVDVKKLVFLMDNLTEMVNPIFRSMGVQLFFDDDKVYRYYYRLDLNQKIIIVSPKDGMKIDFFEHIIDPENLDKSQIYTEKDGKITEGNLNELMETVKSKINELNDTKNFNKEYVINQLFSAFNYSVPEAQSGFLQTPFPEEVEKFYIKTCQIPKDKLRQGIYDILGGSQK